MTNARKSRLKMFRSMLMGPREVQFFLVVSEVAWGLVRVEGW